MNATVDVRNPVELSRAGWNVLSSGLGCDVAQAFMNLKFAGNGDFTKERNERSQMSFDEITSILETAEAEYLTQKAN